MLHHHVEAVRLGAQHDDGGLDVALAKAHTLIGIGHRQVVYISVNQLIDKLNIAHPV